MNKMRNYQTGIGTCTSLRHAPHNLDLYLGIKTLTSDCTFNCKWMSMDEKEATLFRSVASRSFRSKKSVVLSHIVPVIRTEGFLF